MPLFSIPPASAGLFPSDGHATDRQGASGLHQDRLTPVIHVDGGRRRAGTVDLYGLCHDEAVLPIITGADVNQLLAGRLKQGVPDGRTWTCWHCAGITYIGSGCGNEENLGRRRGRSR